MESELCQGNAQCFLVVTGSGNYIVFTFDVALWRKVTRLHTFLTAHLPAENDLKPAVVAIVPYRITRQSLAYRTTFEANSCRKSRTSHHPQGHAAVHWSRWIMHVSLSLFTWQTPHCQSCRLRPINAPRGRINNGTRLSGRHDVVINPSH